MNKELSIIDVEDQACIVKSGEEVIAQLGLQENGSKEDVRALIKMQHLPIIQWSVLFAEDKSSLISPVLSHFYGNGYCLIYVRSLSDITVYLLQKNT